MVQTRVTKEATFGGDLLRFGDMRDMRDMLSFYVEFSISTVLMTRIGSAGAAASLAVVGVRFAWAAPCCQAVHDQRDPMRVP
jgi:hypothetical protein